MAKFYAGGFATKKQINRCFTFNFIQVLCYYQICNLHRLLEHPFHYIALHNVFFCPKYNHWNKLLRFFSLQVISIVFDLTQKSDSNLLTWLVFVWLKAYGSFLISIFIEIFLLKNRMAFFLKKFTGRIDHYHILKWLKQLTLSTNYEHWIEADAQACSHVFKLNYSCHHVWCKKELFSKIIQVFPNEWWFTWMPFTMTSVVNSKWTIQIFHE